MNTIPQTERDVVDHEVSFLSREFYQEQISTLSHNALVEECLRQYDLSGQSLAKYGEATTKVATWREEADRLRRELAIARQDLTWVSAAASGLVRICAAAIIVLETSSDYTHAMKRTARELIKDMLHPEMTKVETAVENAANARNQKRNQDAEIPF